MDSQNTNNLNSQLKDTYNKIMAIPTSASPTRLSIDQLQTNENNTPDPAPQKSEPVLISIQPEVPIVPAQMESSSEIQQPHIIPPVDAKPSLSKESSTEKNTNLYAMGTQTIGEFIVPQPKKSSHLLLILFTGFLLLCGGVYLFWQLKYIRIPIGY